jgi:Tfp pilus assembly PilM family ATPase
VHTSLFFKLFPPPKFLLQPHAGIDISDDAIRFIEYSGSGSLRRIATYGSVVLPTGLIEAGDIKDEKKLTDILGTIGREHSISYAKISIPEEKTYLFETEVPYGDRHTVGQNIEFKIEENVPLAAQDAVFAFDILPAEKGKSWQASVSVVSRNYIERMMSLLRGAGITPVSFETSPRAIARVIAEDASEPAIIIHAMGRKTGVYVVSEHAVGFTSTVNTTDTESLSAEVRRVYAYWLSRTKVSGTTINRVIVVGTDAERIAGVLRPTVADIVSVVVADVWQGILDTTHYVPPIVQNESLMYASAASLAL